MKQLPVFVSSVYGYHTREALVSIRIGDRKPLLIPPDEAREIALTLLLSAEAAEQDAFLFERMKAIMSGNEQGAAKFLDEWRKARQAEHEAKERQQ